MEVHSDQLEWMWINSEKSEIRIDYAQLHVEKISDVGLSFFFSFSPL